MATVLVVDDDADVRGVVEVALNPHRCLFARDGREALTTLGQTHVDVVVLDVMMPDLDGYDTLHGIRTDPKTVDLPVVMLTARTTEDDHLRGFQHGADAYVTKPFDIDVLATMVEEVRTRSPEERARIRDDERAKAALLRQIERRFAV